MGIHSGHRERLRNRFLENGLDSFAPHEVLELLLFYALPRRDTNTLAHGLIRKFGGFDGVLDASLEELESVDGVGHNTAVLLKMIPQLSSFYMESKVAPGMMLNSTQKAGEFFLPKFFGRRTECLYLAALDDKRKVLRCICLEDDGIVNAVSISVKRIVAEAVKSEATGIILAHNHPGGIALPSSNDKWMTRQVYQALRMISIDLVDHIIVAENDFVSLSDSGYFEQLQREAL